MAELSHDCAIGVSGGWAWTRKQRGRPVLPGSCVTLVYRFVSRRVANRDDAADIAQQSLLLALVGLAYCRSEHLLPWLKAIALHLVIDHHRGLRRRSFTELSAALAESEPVLQTRPDTAHALRECRERLSALFGDATRPLRLEHQVALLLSDGYGHTDKASAALLQMSLPCFKLLLHSARNHLARLALAEDQASSPNPNEPLGVICHLARPELLALRWELLEGLKS